MRKLRKQFEKLLLLLAFKMDADPVFQRRVTLAILVIIALIGMVVGYHIFSAACWMACNKPKLFSSALAVMVVGFFSWILYTEKK